MTKTGHVVSTERYNEGACLRVLVGVSRSHVRQFLWKTLLKVMLRIKFARKARYVFRGINPVVSLQNIRDNGEIYG